MLKKAFGVGPILLINSFLLLLFMSQFLPTVNECPEYFLTGYSLLLGSSIALFSLTRYLVVAISKKSSWDLQWGAALIVTLLHAYLLLALVDTVGSCPINPHAPVLGPPLNVVWTIVTQRSIIVVQ